MTGSKWGGNLAHRFFSHVLLAPSGCWRWTGSIRKDGYGRFLIGRVAALAHRVAFHYWRGPIPTGLVVDHICNRRECVRPEHLRLLTSFENLDRSPMAPWNRTNCKKCGGHLERLWNTVKSRRGCKPCDNLSRRLREAARKAATK